MAIEWESLKDSERVAKALYQEYFQQPQNTEFEILSTIRYDPYLSKSIPLKPSDITKDNFYLFEGHVQRLQYSFDFFTNGSDKGIDLTEESLFTALVNTIEESHVDLEEPLKIRFLLSVDGSAKIELHDTPRINNLLGGLEAQNDEEVWDVYVDSTPIIISPFTSFKTTYRPHYTNARNKCLPGLKPGKEEVLVINQNQTLMEGSITNFAIKVDGKWITPTLQSGCLCGVARHDLLKKGIITQTDLNSKDINVNDELLLFNGIMGVVRARVKAIV